MHGHKSNKFDAGQAIELWNNGIPLDRAADAFGNARGQSKIRRAALEKANASAITSKTTFQKAGIDADAFLDAFAPVEASLSANAQIRFAKEDRLFQRLRSGELAAFGFPVHNDGPVDLDPVPIFLFDRPFAKWRKRSFIGHGRHYADVRVCSTPPVAELPPAVENVRQRRGPKSIGPMVEAAMQHLRAADPLFENRSQEKQINEIRVEVARQNPGRFPNNALPGHTTIWNYLTGRKPMR